MKLSKGTEQSSVDKPNGNYEQMWGIRFQKATHYPGRGLISQRGDVMLVPSCLGFTANLSDVAEVEDDHREPQQQRGTDPEKRM